MQAGSGRQCGCVSLLSLGKPSNSMHYSQGHCCKPKRANKNCKTFRIRIILIFLMAEPRARDLSCFASFPFMFGDISLPTMARCSPTYLSADCMEDLVKMEMPQPVPCSFLLVINEAEEEAKQNPSVTTLEGM